MNKDNENKNKLPEDFSGAEPAAGNGGMQENFSSAQSPFAENGERAGAESLKDGGGEDVKNSRYAEDTEGAGGTADTAEITAGRGGAAARKKSNMKILAVILAAAIFILAFFAGFFTHWISSGRTVRTLSEVLRLIDKAAVDYTNSGTDKNGEDAVRAVVEELLWYDRYAQYYTPEEYRTATAESQGNYSGFGVSFLSGGEIDNQIYSVTGNSPADRAGIEAGDVIVAAKRAGEAEFTELSGEDAAIDYLGGVARGEEITLKLKRGETLFEATLKRETYEVAYIEYHDSEGSLFFRSDDGGTPQGVWQEGDEFSYLAEDTAYITFSLFEGRAAEQLETALDFMAERGRDKLILDIRGNGGGYMDVLTDIAALLIDKSGGYTLTYVREKSDTEEYRVKSDKYTHDLTAVTVLADENTASASECLLGAMLCYGEDVCEAGFSLADIIIEYNEGRDNYSTYGKGIMQTTYMLSTGGALKLTTAQIFWPDNTTCVQDAGIVQTDPANCLNGDDAILRAAEILAGKAA